MNWIMNSWPPAVIRLFKRGVKESTRITYELGMESGVRSHMRITDEPQLLRSCPLRSVTGPLASG